MANTCNNIVYKIMENINYKEIKEFYSPRITATVSFRQMVVS
jgi:hypothetical protein